MATLDDGGWTCILLIYQTSMWIDTHAHLDVWSLADAQQLAIEAAAQGVGHCVIPAVEPANFETVRELAHALNYSYALGLHPLYVARNGAAAVATLAAALERWQHDPRLVAVGEIGLDFFVPELTQEPLRSLQIELYREQLKLAQKYQLPVILHVRKSVDLVLKGLRDIPVRSGIAHAFNGSMQQANEFLQRGFKLGFGGAVTYTRALHLQDLARQLPEDAIVLETDAPDIPPTWIYVSAAERAAGQVQTSNTPMQLARIAAFIADLRETDLAAWQVQCRANSLAALPKLAALLS